MWKLEQKFRIIKRRFVIYFRAFTEKYWGITGAIVSHRVAIELFAEIVLKCELKPDEDVKAFKSITIVKMYIQVWSFSKARDIVQKLWVSETTQKKSLQKHLNNGICWKVNAYYSTFSCFTGWSFPGIFCCFILNTYWWFNCKVFSSWIPL